MTMKCVMDHIVLNVEDVETMIAFYREILLLPTERLEEYRAGDVPFPSLRLNPDTIIDLFPKTLWSKNALLGQNRENLNHFCVAVAKSDWDTLINRLQEGKIAVERGPVTLWGACGMGTTIYFRDPETNLIEVRYYETSGNKEA
jgi:extradiol dioxygenase family protein